MNTVTVHGKQFVPYIDSAEIQHIVGGLASQISADYASGNLMVCPVLTGSFMFASDLLKALTIRPEVSFVQFRSYQGMNSTGCVEALLDFSTSCQGRDVLVVEDIIDSGLSMKQIVSHLHTFNPASVAICTMLFKPQAFKFDYKIDYIGRSIPNDFILGYGMDYDGQGRTYQDIYIIKE
ncbi:MAG: hypoxanthine phosphoribosyltransferase [Bacteroidales bacterium]|nr:hypoxanthine phosphoribosyltransferase [Bacteroidales bacterium]